MVSLYFQCIYLQCTCFSSREVLGALESGIGTCSVYCHSFLFLNNLNIQVPIWNMYIVMYNKPYISILMMYLCIKLELYKNTFVRLYSWYSGWAFYFVFPVVVLFKVKLEFSCWVFALELPQKGTNFEKSSKLKKNVKKTLFS